MYLCDTASGASLGDGHLRKKPQFLNNFEHVQVQAVLSCTTLSQFQALKANIHVQNVHSGMCSKKD